MISVLQSPCFVSLMEILRDLKQENSKIKYFFLLQKML